MTPLSALEPRMVRPVWPSWLRCVLATGAYLTVAFFGLNLIVQPEQISIFWPTSGLLLGLLLLNPRRDWPWLLLGTFAADLVAERVGGYNWSLGALYALVNHAEALLGAWLIQRFVSRRPRLEAVREFCTLFLIAGIGGAGLSATLGAWIGVTLGSSAAFGPAWSAWWFSVALGILSVTPLLLTCSQLFVETRPGILRLVEATLLLIGMTIVAWLIFSRDATTAQSGLALIYAPFPFLVWAALRFGMASTAALTLILTFLGVGWTMRGHGPMMFIEGPMAQRVVWLQIYLLVLLATAFLLASSVTERARARQALRASERKFRAIFSQNFQFISLLQPDGSVVEVNETALKFAGIQADTVIDRPFWNTPWWSHSAEEQTRLRKSIQQASGGETIQFETTHRTTTGVVLTVEYSLNPVRDDRGTVVWLMAQGHDITERKRAEQSLREEERRLFQFLEAGPVGVFVLDQHGQTYFANQNAKEILGQGIAPAVRAEDLVQVYQAFVAGTNKHYPTENLPLVRALHGERVSADDMEIHRPDRVVPLQVWAAPIFDEAGHVIFAIAVFADVTERRLAQEKLRASEECFSKAFHASPDAFAITLLDDGRIIQINEGFEKLFGYTSAEAVGRTTLELNLWNDVRDRAASIAQLVATGSVRNLEVTMRHRSGQLHICLASAELIDISGRPCMVSITRDITERKRAEEHIRELNTELEHRVAARTADLLAVNQELEAFSYSISHDLRAPLRHVSGFATLLLGSQAIAADPEARRFAQTIATSAGRLGELIDDLLHFSRMGRAELQEIRFELGELVAQTWQELQAESSGRVLDWHCPALPPVQADRAMLRQVFMNLLGNAIKYTSTRPVARIEVGFTTNEREHIFFVRDNGAGFDMRYVGKLFGVFQRLHREEEFEGTGIGLANVRRIIQRHGGRTWAEGAVDEGATFYFSLPRPAPLPG